MLSFITQISKNSALGRVEYNEEQREKEKTITGRKSKIVCERLPQTITIADDGNTGDYLYDYLLLYANLWIDHCV